MTDEELHAIAPRDLTREARVCYAKEMARRGLPVGIPVEIPGEGPAHEHQGVPVITVDEGVLSYIRKAHTRAVKWSGARGLAFSLSSLVDRLTINSGLLYLAVGFWFVCVVTSEILIPRAYRGRAPILWLRKFRPRPLRGFKFESFLFDACDCLATPFTIQDQSHSYSYETSKGLVAIPLPGLLILPMLAVYHFPELMDDIHSINYLIALIIAGMVVLLSLFLDGSGLRESTIQAPGNSSLLKFGK